MGRRRDSTQLARQWRLIRLLSGPRAWTTRELARALGASKSTIERDLATIEQLFPLVEEADGKQRRRYALPGARLPGPRFTVLELVALRLARALVESLPGAPLASDLDALTDKLAGCAPVESASAAGIVDVPKPGEQPASEAIDTLVDALLRKRACRVQVSTLGPEAVEISPIVLAARAGTLWLRARLATGEVVTLALDALHTVERADRGTK